MDVLRSIALIAGCAIALFFLVQDCRTDRSRRGLVERGTQTNGAVTQAWTDKGRFGSRTHKISYLYYPRTGAAQTAYSRHVPSLDGLEHGTPITVWYDPSRLDLCVSNIELGNEAFSKLSMAGTVLLLIALAVLGGFLIRRIFTRPINV